MGVPNCYSMAKVLRKIDPSIYLMGVPKEVSEIIEENRRRHDAIFGPYDPLSGLNCYGMEFRIHIHIEDFPVPYIHVLPECLDNTMFRQVAQCGSVRRYLSSVLEMEPSEENVTHVIRKMYNIRAHDDPEFALYITDRIQDKLTGDMIPFRLNYPQRLLLKDFEDQRRSGKAVREIVLKARQWGGSTLTQLYIKWIQDFRHDGWNAIIISQIKKTSKKIKAMYKKAIQTQPTWVLGHTSEVYEDYGFGFVPFVSENKLPRSVPRYEMMPYEGSVDDFQVVFNGDPVRRSILSVSAFEIIDNDRGENYHCAHYSEVAYWKATPEHDPEAVISSIHGGIKDIQDNVEVYESTGRGRAGLFYETWQEARDPDTPSSYKPIFIPCFVIEHDHRELSDVPMNISPELRQTVGDDELSFAMWLWNNREVTTFLPGFRESGKFFWRMWQLGASFEAINYYRWERNSFKSHAAMATEYPIDEVEAFRSSGNLVFNPYSITDLQEECLKEPAYRADIVVGKGQKSKNLIRNSNVKVRNDGGGEMKIWSMPNNQILKVRNRYLVSVDIGGNSPNADFTVMTVIDRLGMVPGVNGKPEVVARWRAHCRHDVLAWKAAALAHFYDDALLVIESNTADRERDSNTEGDHFGTIIEEISQVYDNLYRRKVSSESTSQGFQHKYGFQTNKLNKGWLIDNLIAHVEDKLWTEPDFEMYKELSIYERRDDGSMGNIKGRGNHDDVLMSTAIGLWVSLNDMDKPDWIRKTSNNNTNKSSSINEASF